MKKISIYIYILIFTSLISGCMGEGGIREIDSGKFINYSSAQVACKNYIESLITPVTNNISTKKTLWEMRAWIDENQEYDFSRIVRQVQNQTKKYNLIDPKNELDQMKVAAILFDVLSVRSDFKESMCGPDVREYVMESIYLGIGGEDSVVSQDFSRNGIDDSWKQRWILMTMLMAGYL